MSLNDKVEEKLEIGKEVAFCAFQKIWIGKIGVIDKSSRRFEVSEFRPHPLNIDATWSSANVIVNLRFDNYKRSPRSWDTENDLRFSWSFADSMKYLTHLISKIENLNKIRTRSKSKIEKNVQKNNEINHFLAIIEKIHNNDNEVWIMQRIGGVRKINVSVAYRNGHFYIVSNGDPRVGSVWIRIEKFEQSFFLNENDCLTKHRSVMKAKIKRKISSLSNNCLLYKGNCGGRAMIYPKLKTIYLEYSNGLLETGWQGVPKENIYKCFRGAVNNRAGGDRDCLRLIDEMMEDCLIENLGV